MMPTMKNLTEDLPSQVYEIWSRSCAIRIFFQDYHPIKPDHFISSPYQHTYLIIMRTLTLLATAASYAVALPSAPQYILPLTSTFSY